MAAPQQQRFMRRGVSRFYFLKTIGAATGIPTRTELNGAGATDLSPWIASIEGWASESEDIETPDMGSSYTSKIPGPESSADSSFTFYEDLAGDVVEQLLAKDVTGYVVILRKGDRPASKSMDIFSVRVASRPAEYSSGNDPARFTCKFSITAPPLLDQAVPPAT
ncbi:hypothetical protein [Embleya sp. NPDC059237]|uniref:phage tail tube protein n=1 Tax=Embleya sp. NPDC059237 TaxID=3346784 RepID=UPI0036924F77